MTEPLSSFLDTLRGRSVHVVGLASTECTAFLQALLERDEAARVVVHDIAADIDSARATFAATHVAIGASERAALLDRLLRSAEVRLRDRYLEGVGEADLVFVAQSWDLYPANEPLRELVEQHPERVRTLIDLYADHLPCRVIGVTGTNGKTTVASLLQAILEAAGTPVAVSGNHRYYAQVLPVIDQIAPEAVAVLEISHKHLARLRRGPDVAIVTNVAGDHLDELGSIEAYAARKARLVELLPPRGVAVLNADDPRCRAMAARSPGRVVLASVKAEPDSIDAAWLEPDALVVRLGGEVLRVAREAVRLPGLHNTHNALMATAAAAALGVTDGGAIAAGLRSFRGVKHRIEYLRSIDGVRIYDDTAATSPAATEAAIRALATPESRLVLLAGGDDKGNDYTGLQAAVREHVIALVLVPGSAGDRLAEGLPGLHTRREDDLRRAVAVALELAGTGGTVLISPAGAAFFSRFAGGGAQSAGLRTLVREWGRSR